MAKDTPAPPASETVPGAGELRATFVTSMGEITVRLFEAETPRTVANFVGLATGAVKGKPFYDGTIFHRVIPEFMIQGGCPQGTGSGGPGYDFADEFVPTLRHSKPGILSMANRGPNTNGSQFFLTEVPTPHLDGGHTVFGEVIEGVELIGKITHVPTRGGNKPVQDVVLEQVKVFRA